MANQKVTQLPAATTSNDADLLYVVQGTTSRKTTKQLLMASTLAVANAAASTANAATATANAAANTANNALSQVGTAVQKTGDTMTGDLDMGNNQIENLGTPFGPADAATKTYVDTADALKLDKSGGTMTGALNMGAQSLTNLGTPTNNSDATTKSYVDSSLGGKLSLSGGTMSGAINMGSQGLTNLTTPTNTADAATKGYVDTGLAGKQNTVATTTGTAITLVTPQEYGTYAAPATGNIAVSLTNAVRGIDQIVYHDDTVAPTIVVTGGTAIKFGPIDYDLTKVNLIVFFWMGGTNVGYIITPAV
jgi:hypothetical protein